MRLGPRGGAKRGNGNSRNPLALLHLLNNADKHRTIQVALLTLEGTGFTVTKMVNAGIIFAGVWIRDLVVLVAGRPLDDGVMLWQLMFWSPVKALITAAAGAVTMSAFRRWLNVRILE